MKLDANQPVAEAASSHVHFDFSKLSARDRYKLLIGTVIPRPIAFVTTVDEHGVVNAAPFSFFNCLSADPAIVAIGVENHADMRHKDTGHNVRVTEEFTVNIVDDALVAGDERLRRSLSATRRRTRDGGTYGGQGRSCRLPAHCRSAGGARMPPLHDDRTSANRARSFSASCSAASSAKARSTRSPNMSTSARWTRSAGSAAMDIRAAATSSIFRRCRWTSGAARRRFAWRRWGGLTRFDAAGARFASVEELRHAIRRLDDLRGIARCK